MQVVESSRPPLWLFLFVLHHMAAVLQAKARTHEANFNNRQRFGHILFIVADHLKEDCGLDYELGIKLDILHPEKIPNSKEIADITKACLAKKWIALPEEAQFRIYSLTLLGKEQLEHGEQVLARLVLKSKEPKIHDIDKLRLKVVDLIERWVCESLSQIFGHYRDEVLSREAQRQLKQNSGALTDDVSSRAFVEGVRKRLKG